MRFTRLLSLGSVLVATASSTVEANSSCYDYIVVGAGAAGIVVADRLSQAGKKTLLLERGGPSTKETGGTDVPPWGTSTGLTRFDIPGLYQSLFTDPNPYWWCSDIVNYASCLVGGGPALNGLQYFPSPDSEFSAAQGWPQEWRNPSPAIQKMLARLPSTEKYSPDGVFYLDQVYTVLRTHFIKQGYSEVVINDNRNKKDKVFGHPEYNYHNGIRSGVTHTYLQTALSRSNFKLLIHTYVQTIVRNGAQITGVQTNNTVDLPNGLASLTPKGRVIVSSGVFGTARLLFLSGIGPSDMIAQAAASNLGHLLPPSSKYINLPVGYNVADGPAIPMLFTHPDIDGYDGWNGVWSDPRPDDVARYNANRTGVYAGSSPRLHSWKALSGPDGKTRYMQVSALPGGFPGLYGIGLSFVLTEGLTSRGRIGINSSLTALPIVNPWFEDPVDKTVLIQGIKDVIANITINIPQLVQVYPPNTTTVDDWVTNWNASLLSSNHWVGSTRVALNASQGVVDVNCKVFNTNNLFVVDAGIIPGQPMSNTHAAVMTVGEMGVERILALPGGA